MALKQEIWRFFGVFGYHLRVDFADGGGFPKTSSLSAEGLYLLKAKSDRLLALYRGFLRSPNSMGFQAEKWELPGLAGEKSLNKTRFKIEVSEMEPDIGDEA